MLTSVRGWPAFIALLILIGYIEWLYLPAPPLPKSLPAPAEPWQLPSVPKVQSAKALEVLSKTSLWGKLPEVEASKPLTDPPWRFLGIVTNGAERFVLIKTEGLPEKRLAVDDSLPGGSKIIRIDNDSICILINGKKRSLGIYRTGPQAL